MFDDKSDKPSKKPSRRKKPAKTPVIGANGKPVGRGNPPLYTQFKKGKALPNPKGRPKGRSKQTLSTRFFSVRSRSTSMVSASERPSKKP